jgi:hypothetical protein
VVSYNLQDSESLFEKDDSLPDENQLLKMRYRHVEVFYNFLYLATVCDLPFVASEAIEVPHLALLGLLLMEKTDWSQDDLWLFVFGVWIFGLEKGERVPPRKDNEFEAVVQHSFEEVFEKEMSYY